MSGAPAKAAKAQSESQTTTSFFGGGPDRAAAPFFSASVPSLQRKCTSCEAGAERQFQPKLTVGEPNDRFEQEADRTAEQVMRMPEPQVQRQFEPEDEAEKLVQTKPDITRLVQRQAEEVEEEEILQAKEIPGQTTEVTSDVQARINAMQGGGQALPNSERAFFESRLGHNFGRVRVHTTTPRPVLPRPSMRVRLRLVGTWYLAPGSIRQGRPKGGACWLMN